jgi:hypothetical protein
MKNNSKKSSKKTVTMGKGDFIRMACYAFTGVVFIGSTIVRGIFSLGQKSKEKETNRTIKRYEKELKKQSRS